MKCPVCGHETATRECPTCGELLASPRGEHQPRRRVSRYIWVLDCIIIVSMFLGLARQGMGYLPAAVLAVMMAALVRHVVSLKR